MGAQPLGLKATRRIAVDVGQPIKRAVGYGGYSFEFVTFDHRHGQWNRKDRTWEFYEPADNCWSSCAWNFPDSPAAERARQRREAAPSVAAMFDVPVEILVPHPGVPAYLCGATAVLEHDSGQHYEVICALEKDHERHRHECGSFAWCDAEVQP